MSRNQEVLFFPNVFSEVEVRALEFYHSNLSKPLRNHARSYKNIPDNLVQVEQRLEEEPQMFGHMVCVADRVSPA